LARNRYREKKTTEKIAKESLQAGFIGAVISGSTTFFEELIKVQELRVIKNQANQTQKALEEARVEKVKSENTLQDLEKGLKESEQSRLEQQNALKVREQILQEKRLQQQHLENQIEHDQHKINEAKEAIEIAAKNFKRTQEALLEVQQRIAKNKRLVKHKKHCKQPKKM
jgi:hypothetical protein